MFDRIRGRTRGLQMFANNEETGILRMFDLLQEDLQISTFGINIGYAAISI